MCGVCGIVYNSSYAVTAHPSTLPAMMDAMAHRGPDDHGIWRDTHAHFGFRRLSILDVSGGHQPMQGEDNKIISMVNGEIYNYEELRRTLKSQGHRFRTNSDAEVVPHLYEEGGISEVVRQLRGMFAVAIWDGHQQALHLIRDHFGIKPLYYAVNDRELVFASEIRSLLASQLIHPTIHWQALWDYFTFQYVPDPSTMFEGIFRLPPAHYLTYRRGQVSLSRYWQLTFEPEPRLSLAEATVTIQDVLRESVKLHRVSDVPVGAYLSAGIDSSVVVALLAEQGPIDTFSIGFSGRHREINELALARETAKILGTRHHEVEMSRDQYQAQLPSIIASQEEPLADPSAPALYFLAQEAKKYVTVVLSGEGADELFGGYPIYQEPLSLKPFECMSPRLRRLLRQMAYKAPPGMKGRGFIERGTTPLEQRFIGNARMFSDEEKRQFITLPNAIRIQSPFHVTDPYYRLSQNLDDPARMQTVDCHTWLPGDILMKADKMSMAHSLELRVPYLSVTVFEQIAKRLPLPLRLGHGTTKLALRAATKGLLPDAVINRPKLGFPIPIVDWIAQDMRDFIFDVYRSVRPPFLDTAYFNHLLENSQQFVWNRDRKIWTGLTFLLWYQTYFTNDVSALSFAGAWRQEDLKPASADPER